MSEIDVSDVDRDGVEYSFNEDLEKYLTPIGEPDEPDGPDQPDEEGEENENDELQIAARAGIRLLEENLHYREEVGRLKEQLQHLEEESTNLYQLLSAKDRQVTDLTEHLRQSIGENQQLLNELTQLRATRSPSRISPRRGASAKRSFPMPIEFKSETFPHESEAISDATTTCPSPNTSPVRRRATVSVLISSPKRPKKPTLFMYRELEVQYEQVHQMCGTLKLEVASAQRRVTELKPVQQELWETRLALENLQSQWEEQEQVLAKLRAEREEEQALVQSLRETVEVYSRQEVCRSSSTCEQCQDCDAMEWQEKNTPSDPLNTSSSSSEMEQWILNVLCRLVDHWTSEKAKRMQLYDWLTNAMQQTGKQQPLVLDQLTPELALAFQDVFVPLAQQHLNLHVQVQERTRRIMVTDLKLCAQDRDNLPYKTPLYHSLLNWMDGENRMGEEKTWVQQFTRRKSVRLYTGKA